MNHGVYDITSAAYHASAGLSRSVLCDFRRSPLHYWHKHINPLYERPKPSEAMVFGELVHTLVLEPQEFENRYVLYAKQDRRTKSGKDAYSETMRWAQTAGKQAVDRDTYTEIEKISLAVKRHSLAAGLIKDSQIEKSIYWVDEDTGLLCKCRPDIWGGLHLADLKTANDASPSAFQRSICQYNYQVQAAMCRDGVRHATGEDINNFVFIVVEKEPPYAVVCYTLDKEWLDDGEFIYKQVLKDIKACQDNNSWPAYSNKSIYMPRWAG